LALAEAAAAIARLDEALAFHPLRRAFLYRARLDAVRRQAAVDGRLIDPWQLAAVLEGLRLRMDDALQVIERLEALDAARHALALYQWLVAPDFDEEGEVRQAERQLAAVAAPEDPCCSRRPVVCTPGWPPVSRGRRSARRVDPLLGTPRRPPAARAADRRGSAARRDLARACRLGDGACVDGAPVPAIDSGGSGDHEAAASLPARG
jgi:hypothetical protein